MATSPEISVAVLASLEGLESQMAAAQSTVAGAAQAMAQAPQRAGLVARWDAAMGAASRSAKRFQTAAGFATAGIAAAQGDIKGFLNGLPGVFGLVAGTFFSLGQTIREAVTGELKAAEQAAKDLAAAAEASDFNKQARDVDRLTGILQAQDERQKIELTRRREIALARQELTKLENEGATAAAIALVRAKEIHANEKARIALAEYQLKIQEEADAKAKEAAAEEEKLRDAKAQAAREMAEIDKKIKIEELSDPRLEAGTGDPMADAAAKANREMRKAGLQYSIDLAKIRAQAIEDEKAIGEEEANRLRIKREQLLYAEALNAKREIALQLEKDQASSEKERLEAQLAEAEKKAPGGFTSEIQTSVGGSIRVANLNAAGEAVRYQERTATLAEQIKSLVSKIEGKIPASGTAGFA